MKGNRLQKAQSRIFCLLWMFLCLLWPLAFVGSPQNLQPPTVVQINLDDVVHPVSAAYVKDGIDQAKAIGASAVILRLNTPGGLMDSMQEIVKAIRAALDPPRPDFSYCLHAM